MHQAIPNETSATAFYSLAARLNGYSELPGLELCMGFMQSLLQMPYEGINHELVLIDI